MVLVTSSAGISWYLLWKVGEMPAKSRHGWAVLHVGRICHPRWRIAWSDSVWRIMRISEFILIRSLRWRIAWSDSEWRIVRISEFILIRSLKAAKRLRIQSFLDNRKMLTRKWKLLSNNLHVVSWHIFLYIYRWKISRLTYIFV